MSFTEPKSTAVMLRENLFLSSSKLLAAVSSPWLLAGCAAHECPWLLGPAGRCPQMADLLSVQAAELQEGGSSLAKDRFGPGLRAGLH